MKQLALRTTQNVVIEYPAAKIFERVVASLLDYFFVGIVSWFLILILVRTFVAMNVDRMATIFLSMLPILILLLYHTLSEYIANGQSLGKKIMGIRVVRMDGQRAGLREALLRALMLIIDGLFSFGVVGILSIATSRRHQRLGDMAANTVVIKSDPSKPFRLEDIVKIKTLDEYDPTYPQVVQFTERDILQVKEALRRYQKYRNDAHRKSFMKLVKKMAKLMELNELPRDSVKFVKTIIRDYIVLTR